jgi:hypothetical protein
VTATVPVLNDSISEASGPFQTGAFTRGSRPTADTIVLSGQEVLPYEFVAANSNRRILSMKTFSALSLRAKFLPSRFPRKKRMPAFT